MKHLLSWMITPYIAAVALIWCIAEVQQIRPRHTIKRHLSRMIRWNDTVLMGEQDNEDLN